MINKIVGGVLSVFILQIFLCSQDRDIKFRYLTVEDGLSQGSINCIHQDSQGFLWFGTKQGLNRYDGYRIDVFDHDPADDSSLNHNTVNCIAEDKHGDLWVGTTAGLNRFDYKTQKFHRIISDPSVQNSLLGEKMVIVCS